MMAGKTKLSSLLVAQINAFLHRYREELKNKPPSSNYPTISNNSLSTFNPFQTFSLGSGAAVPDPTTANALNTSTVVLRKKSSKKKKCAYSGVPLSNYRIQPNDVYAEVFDWICHYLWLK